MKKIIGVVALVSMLMLMSVATAATQDWHYLSLLGKKKAQQGHIEFSSSLNYNPSTWSYTRNDLVKAYAKGLEPKTNYVLVKGGKNKATCIDDAKSNFKGKASFFAMGEGLFNDGKNTKFHVVKKNKVNCNTGKWTQKVLSSSGKI